MIDTMVHRGFADWFTKIIRNEPNPPPSLVNLAAGPFEYVQRYSAYNVNGFHFRTVARDGSRLTQNSGVFGSFGTRSYASRNDAQARLGEVHYYGKLVDILVLNYNGAFPVPLFKCDWADTRGKRGKNVDVLGITSVNFSRLFHTGALPDDEPYIVADEAQQVYYVPDPKNKDWHMVIQVKPRDVYDMGDEDYDATTETAQLVAPNNLEYLIPEGDEPVPTVREREDGDE